jgi:SAM-dependent methyltransferase
VKSLTSMAATNSNIEFCGVFPESQTGEVLSNVDVVVVPSLCYENYPMTLHEALACNIPVIATNLGGMAEKIKDGFNGFLFNMGDSRHLQTVLEAIVNDPAVLNPLKRNISSMMIPGVEQEAYTYARAYRSVWNDSGSYRQAVANVTNLSPSVLSPPRELASLAGTPDNGGSKIPGLNSLASVEINVNHLGLIPPDELIREHSGGIDRERFISMGDEILQHSLILPSHRILDLGCGCGKLARPLTMYLNSEGGYDGVDITKEVINWCKERYQNYPNFRFHFADLRNERYNPGGAVNASDYNFPLPNNEFDVVFVGSVFTHMVAEDMENYIAEIARVLKVDGVCLATYFVLDAVSRENIAAGLTSPKFAYELNPQTCRVDNLHVPEAAIAYDERFLRDLYGKHGLTIERIVHGEWGRKGLVPHWQDEVWSSKLR